jgi:nitroreductase
MLTVSQAVASRHSIRAFLSDPVEQSIVEELLRAAARAPSGGNLQPWHVDVVSGAALERLKARVREQLASGLETPPFHVYPPGIGAEHEARRRRCGEDLYASLTIERADKPARWQQFLRNYELFDAPVGLFFSIDRSFDRPQWVHLGMFIQTIMLLAEERGLGTCAQESWAAMAGTLSELLELPPERMLYCGLALGWPNRAHPVNGFRTMREPLERFVRWHDATDQPGG